MKFKTVFQNDNEEGILEHLWSQIFLNLKLLAQRYEEHCGIYMKRFVYIVFRLLKKPRTQTKYATVSFMKTVLQLVNFA